MKNILLLVHDDTGQEARLQAALDVTRALDGHLCCVDVTQIPALPDDGNSSMAVAMLLEDERQREATNRDQLEKRLAGEGVSWSWQDATGDLASVIVELGHFADLIVLNRKLDSFLGPDMRSLTGTVLTRMRKPVLAVPDELRRFEVGGRALIAWDGSAAVTAAMRACVPLLQLASEIRLICAETGDEDSYMGDAARYLSRHGISAELRRLRGENRTADIIILEECRHWQASWCLMGAYGHSRLRESLFDGVTRRMLTDCPIPLVLGH